MFAVNLKMPPKKTMLIWIAVIAVVLLAIVFRFDDGKAKSDDLSGSNEDEVAEYITSFGVVVDEDSLITDEIVIPTEFNDVYENYNDIQKKQGFDLENYKGKTLKRYTYKVKNYSDPLKEVFVEVLTDKGSIVGADVYCTDADDGFMMSLK